MNVLAAGLLGVVVGLVVFGVGVAMDIARDRRWRKELERDETEENGRGA